MIPSHLANHPPVNLVFKEVSYSVTINKKFALYPKNRIKEEKQILKNVCGEFRPGQLTAIMGPSGSGKSTLMNILAGYKKDRLVGSIEVNGKPRDMSQFRKLSCYIMQDDVLLPHLTVMEAMTFAAELKLPRKMSAGTKQLIILDILHSIGLMECVKVRSSNVSGGQRKRLAIALELLNNPPVMFFDEPTSGLDSLTCYSCVSLLRKLANQGRTIICTIHQPSARIFEQFDALYLLAGGQNLYQGPTRSLVPFLAEYGLQCPPYHNPADYAIELSIGDYGQEAINTLTKVTAQNPFHSSSTKEPEKIHSRKSHPFPNSSEKDPWVRRESCDSQKVAAGAVDCEMASFLQPVSNVDERKDPEGFIGKLMDEESRLDGFLKQFFTLYKRANICIVRDLMLTKLRLGSTILVGLLIGALYPNVGAEASKCIYNAGKLQFDLMYMVLSAMMLTILIFPLERKVLVREHLNSWYSLKIYFITRICADFPYQLFFPILYTLITYYMTEQPFEPFRVGLVCLMSILVSFVAQAVGLIFGAIMAVQNAVYVASVCTIPVFLFSGFFVIVSTVPGYIRWVSWFSYSHYAFQGTLKAIYGYSRPPLACSEEYCHFKYPEKFLETFDAHDISIVIHSIYLVIMLFVFWVVAYWALRFKIKAKMK